MKIGTKLFLGGLALVGAGFLIHRVMNPKPRLRGPKFLPGDEGVQGVYAEGQLVSPDILGRAHAQVDTDALVDQVLHLTPLAQRQAYDIAHTLWTETDFIQSAEARGLSDAQAKTELVRRVLINVAPQTSWHVPRADLSEQSGRARVWDATAWLVELMGASVEEETREFEKTAAAGGAR